MAVSFIGSGPSAAQAAGTTTSASTVSITPTLPGGAAAGHRIFMFQAASGVAGTTPASWTAVFKDQIIGTGTVAAGSGQRYLSCYYRDYDGSWSMPAFTLTSATQLSHAVATMAVGKPALSTWDTPTFSSNAEDFGTANTAYSATTGSSFTTHRGGFLMSPVVTNDNVTMTDFATSMSGGTSLSAHLLERADGGTAVGNDVSIKLFMVPVYPGVAGTITLTGTLSAASQGGNIWVEQTATPATVSSWAGPEVVECGPVLDIGSATTANVPIPAGVTTDDIIVIELVCLPDTRTVSAVPSGFTLKSTVVNTGDHVTRWYWKRQTSATGAGETTGTYDFTLGTGTGTAAVAHRIINCVTTGDPFDAVNATSPTTNATATSDARSLTTTGTNRLIIQGASHSGGAQYQQPSGFTDQWEGNITAASGLSSKQQAAAGSTGSITCTFDFAFDNTAWLAALIPAATANTGTGSGTYTWAGSAAGKRTPKATASGAYTWAGTAAGKRTPKATASGAYTWAGTAVGAASSMLMGTLTDNFVTQDSAKWTYANSATASGGVLNVPPNASYLPGVVSVNAYNLTGSAAFIETVTVGGGDLYFVLSDSTSAHNNCFRMGKSGTTWFIQELSGGGITSITLTGTYNATNHRWLKMSVTGTTVSFDASPDGTTWTNLASGTKTIATTALYAHVMAGGAGATWQFDNFNAVPSAKTGTGSGAYTWAGTATGDTPPNRGTASGSYTWVGTATGDTPPNRGAVSGTYTWAGTVVGDTPPNRGTVSGAYTWAGAAAGSRTSRGTASGAYTWTGTAAGKRVPKASATGTYTWAGTAAGTRTSRGTASGAYTWAGTATGVAPVVGAKQGTAAGSYIWTGSAVGRRAPKASSAGSYTWAGTAVGDTPPNRGTVSGAYTWAGTATGKRVPKASTTGTYTWAGTAAGARTSRGIASGAYTWAGAATGIQPVVGARQGTAAGAYIWTGSATGGHTSRGTGSGTYTWAGTAVGDTPPNRGTVSGAYTWAGTAAGTRTSRGTASGAYAWAGTATGVAPVVGAKQGTAAGTYTWTGSAVGRRTSRSISSGTYTWAGTATGDTPPNRGTVSGAYTWTGTAAGSHTSRSTGTGTYAWTGTATGVAPVVGAKQGTAAGTYAWAGGAAGRHTSRGTSSGAYAWAGVATGVAPIVGAKQGTAAGTYNFTGSATGRRTSRGTGSGTYGWDGAAVGWRISRGGTTGSYIFTGTATGDTPPNHGVAAAGTYGWAGAGVGNTPPNRGSVTGTYKWAGLAISGSIRVGDAVGSYNWAGQAWSTLSYFPPERTLIVKFENRTLIATAEDRTLRVESENRTIVVPKEDRTLTVSPEDRTLTVSAENHAVAV